MNTLDYLDRPIAFHRSFVKLTGSVNAALMLSQAIHWAKRTTDPDGWFYKSAAEWEEETGLTRRELDTARKLLKDILEQKLAGVPATIHYRITGKQLREWLGNKSSASLAESAKLDSTKTPNKLSENRQTTNSAKTTSTNPSSAHATMIRLWTEAYSQQFGCEYAFQGGKDAKAVKELLASTKLSPEQLIDIAKSAWKNGSTFYCKSAASLTGFNSKFNEIRQELKNGTHRKSTTSSGRLVGVSSQRRSKDYEGVGKIQ